VSDPPYLDTMGMWAATAGLPEQIEWALTSSAETLSAMALPDAQAVRSVAILGMGTAGTAGDTAAAYGAPYARVPISVVRNFELPAAVGEHTLVLAASFSGDTAETLATAGEAHERGARVVVVTGPGALGQWAEAEGLPRFGVPSDLPTSRSALAALTVPLLLTLAGVGIVPDPRPSLTAALPALARRRDVLLEPRGPAGDVARRIGRTIPLVYGFAGLAAVAARRWKNQCNENAKTPAFAAEIPELGHNEVAGWGQNGDVTRQVLSLITLRHAGEHPEVARRYSLVVDVTDEVMANVIGVWAEGDDDLGRFWDAVLFGDLVSLFLAGREGTDPGPTPALGDVDTARR
jgi:glucose/mannose-6-phosphate isomerase